MKNNLFLNTVLPLFVLIILSFLMISPASGSTYRQAQRAEKAQRYKEALRYYRGAINNPATAEAALIQIASIEDNRLNNPPAALKSYREYLKKYPTGRYTRRAEVRIKTLEPYSTVDIKIYHRYLKIKNIEDIARAIKEMETFTGKHTSISYIDEAQLWIANEYRDLVPSKENPKGAPRDLEKAIALYHKIISDEKKGRPRIAAMKNLGDCYLMKKEYRKARKWYDMTAAEGGEFGRLITQKYSFVTTIHTYRNRVFYVLLFLIPLLLGFLAWLLPLGQFSKAGLKTGMKHAAMFLPGAVLFTAAVFMLTDASTDNNTGSEPWLVLVIMATTLVTILFNGLVLEAEERAKIKFAPYLTGLFFLIISVDYLIFYFLDLLHYFEILVTG